MVNSPIGSQYILSNPKKYDKYKSARKKEINKVNKAVLTIKGYKPITAKKPAKGWKFNGGDFATHHFIVKNHLKNLDGKPYTLKLYDKRGKLLSNHKYGKMNYW